MIAATRLQKYDEPSSIWAPDARWCGMELDDWHDSALLVTEYAQSFQVTQSLDT